jgi:inner membrane protein
MDNFTHSLAGWALGQTGLKRKTRKGLAALILGANAPDIDVFFFWVPWAPLATHRGFTHSLVGGFLVLPLGLAALLWLLDRWQVKRGATFKSGLEMRFGWLLALAYLGCLTHPLLDWQTSYAIQLFSPFSNLWFHNDSLFIIDVWIWSGMAFAIWLSRRREKSGGQWRGPAIAAVAALILYISANGVVSSYARQAPVVGPPHAKPDAVVVSPERILFWKRDVIWRQDHAIGRGHLNPFHSLSRLQSWTAPQPDGMQDTVARQGLESTPALVRFGRWSILPMAAVTRERCKITVNYQDARFGLRPREGALGQSVALATDAPGCEAAKHAP